MQRNSYHDGFASVRQLDQWIKQNLHLKLSAAAFPIDDSQKKSVHKSSGLVKGAVACVNCPKRTGTNPQLFSDVKESDICTDPKCFLTFFSSTASGTAPIIAQVWHHRVRCRDSIGSRIVAHVRDATVADAPPTAVDLDNSAQAGSL